MTLYLWSSYAETVGCSSSYSLLFISFEGAVSTVITVNNVEYLYTLNIKYSGVSLSGKMLLPLILLHEKFHVHCFHPHRELAVITPPSRVSRGHRQETIEISPTEDVSMLSPLYLVAARCSIYCRNLKRFQSRSAGKAEKHTIEFTAKPRLITTLSRYRE